MLARSEPSYIRRDADDPERHLASAQAAAYALPLMTRITPRGAWLALAAVVFGAISLTFRHATMDDAYIGFTYLRNVLHGKGFVFYGAPPVEGVTNIGWLFTILPLSWLVGPALATRVVGVLAALATLWLTDRIARSALEADARWWAAPFVLLATASSFDFVFFTTAGMETSFLALVVLGTVVLFLSGRRVLAATLSLVAFLVHPEAVAIFPLMVVLSPSRKRALRALGFLVSGALAITALRYAYFGMLVPNTFFAKPGSGWQAIMNLTELPWGGPSNLSEPFARGWLLLPVGIGAVRLTRRAAALGSALTGVVLVGVGFALYSRPDWTGTGRYFAPYLPCALVLLASGLIGIEDAIATRAKVVARVVTAGLVVLALALPVRKLVLFERGGWTTHPGFVMAGVTLAPPTLWLRDHLPPDAVIATRRIGAVSYFSERHVFDFKYGLTEPRVARIIFETRRFPVLGESPAFDAVWRDVHPGYILEDANALAEFKAQIDPQDGSMSLLGERFERVMSFPVSSDRTWVLLRRSDLAAP